jgi:hypothetical protein
VGNNFPVLPDLRLSALQYSVDIAGIGGAAVTFPAGSLHLITTTFETGVVDGVLQFDYSTFDQGAHEAVMKQMLNGLCGVMASGMGITLGTVQAAITITRTWIFAAADPAVTEQFTMTDQMPYP